MKLKSILVAGAVSFAALSSGAADNGGGPIDLSSGSAAFSRTPLGSGVFTDTYTLTIPTTLVSGSIVSSQAGAQDIDFTSITIMYGGSILATFTNIGTDAQEVYVLGPILLSGPATYSLVVVGTQSADGATYAGNLALAIGAVPEPESYAMLLAGLGLIGLVANRRRG